MKKDIPRPKIQVLESQLKELTQALQRERADAINVRRRVEEERAGMGDFYKAAILSQLLPAIDNLERAHKHIPDNISDISRVRPWKEGVQGVVKQFEAAFKQLGVERIKTVGEHFDPHLHEAVHLDDGGGEHEVISEELQAGYKIGDEVIRPAMVKVKKEKK